MLCMGTCSAREEDASTDHGADPHGASQQAGISGNPNRSEATLLNFYAFLREMEADKNRMRIAGGEGQEEGHEPLTEKLTGTPQPLGERNCNDRAPPPSYWLPSSHGLWPIDGARQSDR